MIYFKLRINFLQLKNCLYDKLFANNTLLISVNYYTPEFVLYGLKVYSTARVLFRICF